MSSGLLEVMKGILCNNLYYLKGSVVIKNLASLEHLKDDSTKIWHMRLRHTGEKSLQVLTKKGSSEGASTCNLEFGEHDILDK